MPQFLALKSDNKLKETIATTFDMQLDISGSWGYTQEDVTIIHHSDTPLKQFQHMFASLRAYMEMNIMQHKEARYGSINLSEIDRKSIIHAHTEYEKVSYSVTAMREDIYATFISEYKAGYGKKDFNLSKHFQEREEAMLRREVSHWFCIEKNA